eukprot:CAMPEP_0172039850 /NCGR_PEP_ID=MMETSP1041-20130122/24142_1 /TAXON_ID=464988 /ORGANISM="Hemiselmis andersenii, Strain CCMP439" /LENGTH=81 /DNA_ID=CAMNT_0012697623 /DNA_START=178 /DNA_END=420 /DNA_ORIENTATION=-
MRSLIPGQAVLAHPGLVRRAPVPTVHADDVTSAVGVVEEAVLGVLVAGDILGGVHVVGELGAGAQRPEGQDFPQHPCPFEN